MEAKAADKVSDSNGTAETLEIVLSSASVVALLLVASKSVVASKSRSVVASNSVVASRSVVYSN